MIKKISYSFFLLLLLSLGILSSCQQGQQPGKTDSQQFAIADNYFNYDQTWELSETKLILQELNALSPNDSYSLGYVIGRAESLRSKTDAYHTLIGSAPSEVVDLMVPQEWSEAYSEFSNAQRDFLNAILEQNRSSLTNPDSSFRRALPSLLDQFDTTDLSLREVRNLETLGSSATETYLQNLSDTSQQLRATTDLLLKN